MLIYDLIKDIQNKKVIPSKIYKTVNINSYTIEIETVKPLGFISLMYKTESERDSDYNLLDTKVFAILTFNPYNLTN